MEFDHESDRIKEQASNNKYVCISEHSTNQRKYWNNPTGWQIVVDYLNDLGYKVVVTSREDTSLNNVIKRIGKPIERIVHILNDASLFIGVSAGPIWLAWALNIPTVMIAGSSERWAEFKETEKNLRVMNESVCHGCGNNPDFDFARGNWNVCPRNKDFECTKQIYPSMVIGAVEKMLR